MNSRLFSFVVCTIYCIGFVCGSPVETRNETDAVKIIPKNIPPAAVTTLSPPTKDLKPENKTTDAKNGTVIADKTEFHATEKVPTQTEIIFATHNATTVNTTVYNSTITTSNKTKDNITSTSSTSRTPAITPTKEYPPSEVTTPRTTATMTVSSTTTYTVNILPTSKIEEKEKDRGFDGPSFIGGIVLALGLTGIGFVAYKFCKARTDRNYMNL